MKNIYFDNAATTQTDPRVIRAMLPYFDEKYGNASSLHTLGQEAKNALEKARQTIAKSINAKPDEIIFTSGGTESNNLALKGVAFASLPRKRSGFASLSRERSGFANCQKGNHIITTKIEHKCVLKSCDWLVEQGFKITYLNVDQNGFIRPTELKKAITPKTILVSIIHANNETGTIQNLEAIGRICRKNHIYFHTDACQSYTKTELDVKKYNLDLITLNAHKIHGPKGVGALYVKSGTLIEPWQHGGGHEHKLRAGTENIAGIVGFSKAVEIASNIKYIKQMTHWRDKLIKEISRIPDTRLNGPTCLAEDGESRRACLAEDGESRRVGGKRLCNNVNFSFRGIEGESLGKYLDEYGIATSTGSACSALTLEPSYVLKAMGLSDEQANGSLRISLSRFNTEKEIDYLLKILPEIVKKLRKISPIYSKFKNSKDIQGLKN